MARQKLFVSFDFDNDATLKMLFVNQSKHPDAPFDIWDSSVKEHILGDWQAKVKARMRNVDIVCVLCSTTTHTAKGVAIELPVAEAYAVFDEPQVDTMPTPGAATSR